MRGERPMSPSTSTAQRFYFGGLGYFTTGLTGFFSFVAISNKIVYY
jgi:hypothetical protein